MILINHKILYIISILLWIDKVILKSIEVSSENEFKDALHSNYSEIKINSSLTLQEKYKLNSLRHDLTISGKTNNITLYFNNSNDGFFFNYIDNIEISNLRIIGNLVLESCKNISISNVDFNGLIESKNSNILFFKSKYSYIQDQALSLYGIYLVQSSINIYESRIYGSQSISQYIIYLTKLDKIEKNINNNNNNKYNNLNKLSISNSHLSGEFKCGIIKVDDYSDINIQFSELINAVAYENGSVLNAMYSKIYINGCGIRNNVAYISGGSFYLIDNESFKITNCHVTNSTGYLDVIFIYLFIYLLLLYCNYN
ncbi:hypothetical protein BCR36DRAFT_288434 [Piromyces finnis]|uniref:Right handed beta helix domain-containing protein n=1 Tax=Piromyces finnis TaxID=1754191 RepID=A0A1Y1VAJ3_9FUNG|nr:hypothetical protein BCR36DRAFT_288434 [Piromyces finnis]|eukprot:ORX51374.1 hypothetical protein BCR36DRAFT_288434 [Piromyces finnis]